MTLEAGTGSDVATSGSGTAVVDDVDYSPRQSKANPLDNDGWEEGQVKVPAEREPQRESEEEEPEDVEQVEDDQEETEEEEEEPEAEEPVEEPEAAPENVSAKAQKRFHKLAQERNQRTEENRQLREALVKSQELVSQVMTSQQKLFGDAQTARDEHRARQQQALLIEQLRAEGYQEGDFGHDKVVGLLGEFSNVKAKLEQYEQREKQRESESRISAFKTALRSEFDATFTKLKRELPKEVKRSDLEEQAFAMAATLGLTPNQAVGKVVSTILPLLRAPVKKGAKKVIPADQRSAHDMVSMKGRGAFRKPGDSASGKSAKKSIKQIEKEMRQSEGSEDWID